MERVTVRGPNRELATRDSGTRICDGYGSRDSATLAPVVSLSVLFLYLSNLTHGYGTRVSRATLVNALERVRAVAATGSRPEACAGRSHSSVSALYRHAAPERVASRCECCTVRE